MCNVMSVLLSDCPPCPFSPFFPALPELRQADLITSEEYEELRYISEMVEVQSSKSPEVVFQTADVLRRHGLEKESKLLAGRQSRPSSICLFYVVQWSLLMMDTL